MKITRESISFSCLNCCFVVVLPILIIKTELVGLLMYKPENRSWIPDSQLNSAEQWLLKEAIQLEMEKY